MDWHNVTSSTHSSHVSSTHSSHFGWPKLWALEPMFSDVIMPYSSFRCIRRISDACGPASPCVRIADPTNFKYLKRLRMSWVSSRFTASTGSTSGEARDTSRMSSPSASCILETRDAWYAMSPSVAVADDAAANLVSAGALELVAVSGAHNRPIRAFCARASCDTVC
eukprot:1402264-Prymnesium_polylepis.3